MMISKPLSIKIYQSLPKYKVGRTSQECSICLQPIQKGDVIRKLPCNHIFHGRGCLRGWMVNQSSCPNCRLNLIETEKPYQKQKPTPDVS